MKVFLLISISTAAMIYGQTPLSLKEAIGIAVEQHPAARAAKAGQGEAQQRVAQVSGGLMPRVNYSESWQRSDNPVFVFGSLLTQRQFTEKNFAIGSLNSPNFVNNFQSQLVVDQPLFDAGMTRHAKASASLMSKVAGENTRRTDLELTMGAVRAYSGTLLAAENVKVAEEAVKSAEADLERATAVRNAGMITDADVLSIRVHLAGMKENVIRARNDFAVAKAALNEALGQPLDKEYLLTTPLIAAPVPQAAVVELEKQASAERPELRQARLAQDVVGEQKALAKAALLPQVSARGMIEADRANFVNKGGVNYFAAVTLRWNLFNGNADKYKIEETRFAAERAAAEAARAENGVKLQVRKAYLDLQSAGERIDVAKAAIDQATESHRIIQNRYEAGLTTVTELLRSETALLMSKMRLVAAIHDQRLAAANLLAAAGLLNKDSEL